jgi:hypothetical protein
LAFRQFAVGCPCCCGGFVGFEHDAMPHVYNCCDKPMQYLSNLKDDLSRLDELDMVFAGPIDSFTKIKFSESDWPTLRQWLEDGGKMYVSGEFYSVAGETGYIANINSFVEAMGSEMRIQENYLYNDGGGCHARATNIAPDLPVMKGVTKICIAATNKVTGGTPLCETVIPTFGPGGTDPDPVPFIAIEKIGDGWLCFCGDSNCLGNTCSGYQELNCPFVRNMISVRDWI